MQNEDIPFMINKEEEEKLFKNMMIARNSLEQFTDAVNFKPWVRRNKIFYDKFQYIITAIWASYKLIVDTAPPFDPKEDSIPVSNDKLPF